jgi:hypothetical protein
LLQEEKEAEKKANEKASKKPEEGKEDETKLKQNHMIHMISVMLKTKMDAKF